MTPLVFLAVVAAGGLGAGARYLLDTMLLRLIGPPWGIFVVNVLGSFALGLVVGFGADAATVEIAGAGFLGGFTTFSAVSVTTVVLAEEQRTRTALFNGLGTFVLAVAAAWGGLVLGANLAG